MTISRRHWLGLALSAILALPAVASGQTDGAALPGRPVVVHAGPVAAPADHAVPGDTLASATAAVAPSQPTTSDNSTTQPNTVATTNAMSSTEAKAAADAKPSGGDVENRPIGGQRRQGGGTRQGGDAISQWLGPTWWALLIVLGVIFLAAYVLKRITPGITGNRQGGLFRVLARWHLSPKQLVALIQVGRRMLLVGVTRPTDESAVRDHRPERRSTTCWPTARRARASWRRASASCSEGSVSRWTSRASRSRLRAQAKRRWRWTSSARRSIGPSQR